MVLLNVFRRSTIEILFFFALGSALVILAPGLPNMSGENVPLIVPPQNLKYFTIGYSEVLGDALWLRVIQDFDYCENRPPGITNPALFKCSQGWVYRMIDSITEVAPDFKEPYIYGGLMLSIVVNDTDGASKIFDRGVRRFPHDWIMLYRASYHALLEEKDDAKASHLLNEAGKNGAPPWVYSLAARLNQKLGRLDLARSIVASALEGATDRVNSELFRKRLAEIDQQIAEEKAKQKH